MFAHVLSSETDIEIQYRFGNFEQGGEWRTNHNVHLFHIGQLNLQTAHEVQALGHGLIHLPIARNYQFSFFIHNHKLPSNPPSNRAAQD